MIEEERYWNVIKVGIGKNRMDITVGPCFWVLPKFLRKARGKRVLRDAFWLNWRLVRSFGGTDQFTSAFEQRAIKHFHIWQICVLIARIGSKFVVNVTQCHNEGCKLHLEDNHTLILKLEGITQQCSSKGTYPWWYKGHIFVLNGIHRILHMNVMQYENLVATLTRDRSMEMYCSKKPIDNSWEL